MAKRWDDELMKLAYFLIRHWLAILIILVALFIIPIVGAPYLMATGNPTLQSIAGMIMLVYRTTCHQLPERTLFVFGYQMTVCSRCFAIYTGALIGCLAFIQLRKKLKIWDIKYFILFGCVPMAIDGFAQLFSFPIPRTIDATGQLVWMIESTQELRIITGLIFGLASMLYVLPYLEEIFTGDRHYNGNKIEKPTQAKDDKGGHGEI